VTQAKEEMEKRLSASSTQPCLPPSSTARRRALTVEQWPHMVNLNEDMLLTGRIKHWLPQGKTLTIGLAPVREKPDPSEESDNDDSSDGEEDQPLPNVVLSGLNIFHDHATITNLGHCCVLHSTGEASHNTYVGGVKCSLLLKQQRRTSREGDDAGQSQSRMPGDSLSVVLKHGDTIAFGHCLFFFVDPTEGSAEMLLLSNQVSYDASCRELTKQRWDMSRKKLMAMNAMKAVNSFAHGVDPPCENDVGDLLLAKDRDLRLKDKQIQKLKDQLAHARRELVKLSSEAPPVAPSSNSVVDAGGAGKMEVDMCGEVAAVFGKLIQRIEKAEQELFVH